MAQTKPTEKKSEAQSKSTKVKFDYIKSNHFRVVHVDGVFGGVSPSGKISIGFWNQRSPFPQRTVQVLDEDGRLGEELRNERISRDAIVREIETNVVMDVDVAKGFLGWLKTQIAEAEKEAKTQTRDI